MPEDERDEAYGQIALMREKIAQIREDLENGVVGPAREGAVELEEMSGNLYAEVDKLARAQAAREGQS